MMNLKPLKFAALSGLVSASMVGTVSLLSIATVGFTQLGHAQSTPYESGAIVLLHKSAINRGDAAEAMSYLTEDIRYVAGLGCPPTQPCKGQEAVLRGYAASAVAMKQKIVDLSRIERTGDIYRVRIEVSWPGIEAIGAKRLIGTDEFTLRDGRISSVEFKPDMSDAETNAVYSRPAPPKQ